MRIRAATAGLTPNVHLGGGVPAGFGFDEQERDEYLGGYVAAAFYLVGAPAALLFGYLSDTVNRRNLLFAAVLLGEEMRTSGQRLTRLCNTCLMPDSDAEITLMDAGEAPCVLMYFVTKYWQLLVLRLLTGISLGGTFPLVFSLLGDLYEPRQRAGISAVVQVATGAGLALGQGIAGFLGPAAGWRWPFVVVALPATAVAVLMLLTTEEPQRGVMEAALQEGRADDFEYTERITAAKVRLLVRIPTNVLVIAQGLPGCLPWGMLLTFFNDYLAQNKGLSVSTATTVVLAVGIGGAVGVIGGGLLGQWLYNRWKWTMPVFIGACTIVGALPMWFLVNADVRSMLWLAYVMAFTTGVASSTVGPNMRAMIMNVNEPETRGVALALQTMLDDLGKGLGPAIVAAIISKVGRTTAFNISVAGWIPCGMLLLGTALTLESDEGAMDHRLKATMSRLSLASSSRGASALELTSLVDASPVPIQNGEAGNAGNEHHRYKI